MKKDEKNGSTGRTICTRSSAVAPASTEQETPGLSLRRSARGTQSTSTKPVTPTSSTRRSERLASSPASVTKNSGKIEKKPTASPLRRSHKAKNVSSDKPARNANTSSSDTEESKGKAIDDIEESTDEIKKHEPKMTGRYYRALYRGHLKKEPNASSLDDELVVVGCSRRVPAGNDDARDDNHSPYANSESKGLPAAETSLEKGPDFPVDLTRDAEKMVLDSPPMVDTGDGCVIGSPSENPETQRLRDSKTSLETDIDLPLKRKRDTAEIVMDACANADDRIMSSDGDIPSPSGCPNNNQPDRCGTCQKRQKVNDDFENLSVCSCIAQPVQESDHVAQDMKESGPATSRDYGENRQKMQKSYDPKFSSMYPEYWVPVQLSDVQMEQYCRSLFSKSLSLSSLSKNDLVGALEGTLTSVRKTCDHPYVMDASLKQLLTKNLQLHEILDVEVKASGKLHLLDAMLTQINAKGLKAVVFYQATQSPEGLLLANILEDFVSQRFGRNSYEHGVSLSKKTAINNFNKESQCFILLLETRACSQSIKLLRAEAFIIFGSSLNPSLDVKLLEKIKIESYSERTKIFRLYSVCTVEEKALILARQNKPLENISRPLTHALLMWGASYLFEKLDHFHGTGTLDSGVPLEKSIKDAVIHEFSSIISSNVGEENEGKRCLLLEAKHVQGNYSTDATLFGEEHVKLSDDISPNIFWAKLLGGKNPMWKYYSDTPQRCRKRVRHLQGSEETAKVGDGGKKKKASDDVAVDNDERKASRKDHIGDLKSSKVTTLQSSRGSASGTHENDVTGLYSMGSHISGIPEDMLAGIDWQQIPRESQRSLYAVIKPEMAKLCLSEDSASMAEKFLEYIIENHRVCKEPATTLQAFQIALSWIAASFVKQKCNREESLVRAKSELGFNCSKEEVDYVYSFLYCMKSLFLGRAQGLQLDCLGTKSVNESLSGDTVRQEKNNTKLMRSSDDGEECMTEKRGSHYSSVTKDVEETISCIKKKFSKKLQKLVQTHEEKKMELMNRNAAKKQKLQTSKKVEVSYIRVTCSGLSTQSLLDNLQRVEDDFQRKNDDLKRETDECLESLEQMHEAAKKKLAEDEACWISRIENWAQTELINCAPTQSCNNKHLRGLCSSNTSKNAPDVQICNDASGEATYADTNCMVAKRNHICDRVTSATRDEDVPSRVPDISQSFANLAKSASLESSLNREDALVSSHAGSDVDNILDQQNEEACSPDELALPMPHPASVVKTRGSSESDQDDHEICPMPSSPGGKQPDLAANIQGKNIEVAIEPEPAESPMLSSPARQQPGPAANKGKNIETAIEPQTAGPPMPSSSAGQQPDPAEKNIEAAIEAQPAESPSLSSPARQQPDPAASIQGENIETAIEPQRAVSPMPSSSAGQQPDPAEKNIEASIEAQPAESPMLSSPARQQPGPAANIQGENIETAIEPQLAGSPMPSSSAGQQPDPAEKNIEAAIEAQPAESPMLSSPAIQQPEPAANNPGENIETAVEPQPAGSPMPSSLAGQQPDPAEKNIEAAIEAQPAGSLMPCSTSGKQPDPAANIQGKNIDVVIDPEPAESPMPSSPARQQPDPAANIQGENIETAIEPQPAGSPMPSSSAGQQPDLAEKNIEAAVEAQPAGSETVETGGFAALEQVDQVACPLPSSSAGNQPDSGASIESQDISTSAEPHIAGPGAVETGDTAVLDQEIMGGRAQDACSLPSPLIGTQADLAANTDGQNIATVAQLHTAGSDAVETCPDASSPGNQFDAAVNIESLNNSTTVAAPHTTGSNACEMEVAEPDAQVEQSTFANNDAPLVHEGVLEPSAGVIAPAPSLLNSATGQSANRPVPQIPFPVFSDPFQHELEKLRRESENTKKTYEEKKSVLKAELDRKMAELQAEYQRKFHEVEAERTAKTMKIETSKNLVTMNKLLASAFLSKCTSRMASHPSGRIQQLAQRAAQVNALRNYYTASAPTLAPAPLQAQTSSFPSSVSRSSGLLPNSMHCPMPQPRQPLISNTAPSLSASPLSATNLAVNARLVSPLPHINSYRSSSSSVPIPTTTPTSSAVPQASTYPTALSQQQEQRHQQQQNLGSGLQGSNDVVCLSDDE